MKKFYATNNKIPFPMSVGVVSEVFKIVEDVVVCSRIGRPVVVVSDVNVVEVRAVVVCV